MLDFLPLAARDPRKARLVAVACCRRFPWVDPRSWAAADVAERFADGRAGEDERRAAEAAAAEACRAVWPHGHTPGSQRVEKARCVAEAYQRVAAPSAWFFTEFDYHDYGLRYLLLLLARGADDAEAECRFQADLLRDVFGNPFRDAPEAPVFGPRRGRRVTELAASIYAEQSFRRLPELADLLEEFGCRDRGLLLHCRRPAVHARGCWAVDLLLSHGAR
jgi:hypothetical protein